ncbi:MAG: hypothetical protein QOK01_2180 [Alphaproteobacteria bacterium]|nr:hypothetical protein [Alphaproteobacteria bacterium]
MSDRTFDSGLGRPRRRWRLALLLALVVLVAAGWTGLWSYAAKRADAELAAWRNREAAAGRVVGCGTQRIAGFPFRIEITCVDPTLNLQASQLTFRLKDLLAAVQIYQPTLLIGEFTGPLTVANDGRPPDMVADWSLAQTSVHGLPSEPDRVSVVLDKPSLARPASPAAQTLASAQHLELHARQAPRLPQDPPVLDLALDLRQALLPAFAQVPEGPIDAEIAATLRGLTDLRPKPLPALLRDLQAANGRLDITHARVRQGEIIGVGQGTLSLTARGTLDGQLQLTVAGIEQLMTALGLDKKVGQASQNALDRVAPGLNLDRLLGPRGNAALAAAGVAMLGQPAELEGRRAVTLPLRFADGVVFLGPLRAGELPPLF